MVRRVDNPPNRFESQVVEWLDAPPDLKVEVYEEEAKSIITENKSPDVGFSYSVNPYRGCFHACAYCYARPTHQYLGFGAGTDFESKIVVKTNAAELLHAAFMKPGWKGDSVLFSGNTDCYQPLECSYRLSRRCLEVCAAFHNPVAIITKGALIQRDLDILKRLNDSCSVQVIFSIAFSSDRDSKLIEPHAPRPSVRFRAMRALHEAGIPIGVGVAPVIPALNDFQIPEILEQARDCGAETAFMTLLRLPAEVEPVFIERLNQTFPHRSRKVLNSLRQMKGGRLNRSEFGKRMRGEGDRYQAVDWLFEQTCKRLGFNEKEKREAKCTFRRPDRQLSLF